MEIICLIIILISTITSIVTVMKSKDLNNAIEPIISGISTVVTFFVMVIFYKYINDITSEVLNVVLKENTRYNGVIHIGTIVGFFILIKFIIELLLSFLQSFSFGGKSKDLKLNKIFLFIFSLIFGMIKGIVIIIVICIPVILYNNSVQVDNKINYFDNLSIYTKLNKMVNSDVAVKLSDDFFEQIKEGGVVYFNGITAKEGVRSNDDIKNMALSLTKNDKSDIDKAKRIYNYITTTIVYDDYKAEMIVNPEITMESGAIPTFRDKKGICFDYACLYYAMLKDIGIKSSIVIGEGYNGVEFISHAWNKVYISEKDTWINVDTTFGTVDNYFNNEDFDKSHKEDKIINDLQ